MCSLAASNEQGGIHPSKHSGAKSSEFAATELDASVGAAYLTTTSFIGMNSEQIKEHQRVLAAQEDASEAGEDSGGEIVATDSMMLAIRTIVGVVLGVCIGGCFAVYIFFSLKKF